jgi:hypothetical protein
VHIGINLKELVVDNEAAGRLLSTQCPSNANKYLENQINQTPPEPAAANLSPTLAISIESFVALNSV